MRPGFAGREAGSSNLSSEIFSPQPIRATLGAPLGHTWSVRSLGSRLAQCSSGLRWNSWQGIASGPRWRARLERVPGAARLTLQVSENPIDDSGLGDQESSFPIEAVGQSGAKVLRSCIRLVV